MIIKIKNFKLETILGIYEWEQTTMRPVVINAEIHTNFDNAKFSNSIDETIDYDTIIKQIKNYVSSKKFQLIEKMNQEILEMIMSDGRIDRCILEIDKIGVIKDVESFSVTLTKERGNGPKN